MKKPAAGQLSAMAREAKQANGVPRYVALENIASLEHNIVKKAGSM
jgi:hypothetical protein